MSGEHDLFRRRSNEMMTCYHQGDYSAALVVTEQLAAEFPGQFVVTTFWRICLLGRLKKIDTALDIFSESLKAGMWWSESTLRRDPDLQPLQGSPEFERLVTISEKGHGAAQAVARPEMVVREPATGCAQPYPLLIVLHGQGGTVEDDLESWQRACSWGWLTAALQSAQLALPGAYTWDNWDEAQEQVLNQFERLSTMCPVDRTKVVVGGFSQGAALAIRLVLNGLLLARGFLSVVPGVIDQEMLTEWAATKHDQPLRGYIVAGGEDPRYAFFKQTFEMLPQFGIPCQVENHPEMGHEFPPTFEKSLENALEYLLSEE